MNSYQLHFRHSILIYQLILIIMNILQKQHPFGQHFLYFKQIYQVMILNLSIYKIYLINFRKDKSCDRHCNQNYDNLFILVTIPTFHFNISGNFDNEEQSAKIPLISLTFLYSNQIYLEMILSVILTDRKGVVQIKID